MARPLGSGPIHIWVGFGPPLGISAGTPPTLVAGGPATIGPTQAYYWGTTRSGVDTDEELAYYQVMNDLTGPQQSMDSGYAGREDRLALTSSSWSQSVDNNLEAFLRPNLALPVAAPGGNPLVAGRGVDALSDIGTLMISEGKTLQLWLIKAAAGKAVNVASGMPLGRWYFTVIMTGPNKLIEGNRENLRVRVFTAKKNITALNTGNLPLYSENPNDWGGTTASPYGNLPAPTFG